MIAITGVTGQLGRQIVEELLKRIPADQIVGVARTPEKALELTEKGVIIRQGDYADKASLGSSFQGIDVLMFISNIDIEKREEQHNNIVDAAKEAGVGRVVYTSVLQSGKDDLLSMSHANTEAYIKASDLPYTFLRNSFYMESYLVEVEIAIESGVYRSPAGADTGVSLVKRTDIARAAAVVLSTEGHIGQAYDMTGPEVVTPKVFAEVAADISGMPVTYQPVTWEELAKDYKERGYDEARIGLSVLLEKMVATNTFSTVSDDIEELTGTPPESFLSFARYMLKDNQRGHHE